MDNVKIAQELMRVARNIKHAKIDDTEVVDVVYKGRILEGCRS